MIRYLVTMMLTLSVGFSAKAQYDFKLQGEGTQKQVKLCWVPAKWYDNMDGVVIKRREVSKSGRKSAWVALSKTTIHPGTWQDKDLSNISNSQTLSDDLRALRAQLSKNTEPGTTQLHEIKEDELKKQLNDANGAAGLGIMFAFDYDLALLLGFGYVDEQYPQSYALEYGVFPVVGSKVAQDAAQTLTYKTGAEPSLSFAANKCKVSQQGKDSKLWCRIDIKELRKVGTFVGFNVYRKPNGGDYSKVTTSPVMIDKSKDDSYLGFSDTLPDESGVYSYAIAAASLFKNESKKYEIPYRYPGLITPPVLKCTDEELTDYVANGVSLEWTFSAEQESGISGFVVERQLNPADTTFTAVTGTLPASTRKYHDSKVPPPSTDKVYIYRITAVRDRDAVIETYPLLSNSVWLFYSPKKTSPKAE